MNSEEQLTIKRFLELSARSEMRGIYVYTDFLNLNEQSLLLSAVKRNVTLFGGHENAERNIAIFGNSEEFGYEYAPPVKCLKAEPLNKKFSDELSHRDFLGSLMNLGIKRETLGDIIINENTSYIFCLETVAEYLCDNLTKVKHTNVKCTLCEELPEETEKEPEERIVHAASERLDAVTGAVYNLSRSESALLITSKKVFVNSKLCENTSYGLKPGDIVSVRGFGRYVYSENAGKTKKDRLKARILIY